MACTVCVSLGLNGADHNKRTCQNTPEAIAKRQADFGAMGGRPKEHVYDELFKALNDPPTNPLKINRWAMGIVSKMLKATAQGYGNTKRNAEITKLVRAIVSLTPKDLIYEAQERLREDYRDSTDRKQRDSEPLSEPVGGSSPLR